MILVFFLHKYLFENTEIEASHSTKGMGEKGSKEEARGYGPPNQMISLC